MPASEDALLEGELSVPWILVGLWGGALLMVLGLSAFWLLSRPRKKQARRPPVTESSQQHRSPEPSKESKEPAQPGVSLKQLMKNSKKQAGKSSAASKPSSSTHPLCINTLKGHGDAVLGLDISGDGSCLATACQDRVVRVFSLKELDNKALSFRQKRLPCSAVDIAFGPTPDSFAVLSLDMLDTSSLIMYTSGQAASAAHEEQWRLSNIHQGSKGLCLRFAGGQNGVFLSASNKADMRVVDAKGNMLARVDAAGLETYGTALSADGRFLAAATFTPDVKVHEVRRDRNGAFQEVAKVNLNLKAHSKGVTCLAFAADGSKAVTASKDGTWAVWDLRVRYHLNQDPKLLHKQSQEVPSGQCFSHLAYGPKDVVAAAFQTHLQFLSAKTGQVLETVECAHDAAITALHWSPVSHGLGRRRCAVLASSGLDKRVCLFRSPDP